MKCAVLLIAMISITVLAGVAADDEEVPQTPAPKKCIEECPTNGDAVCGYDSNCYNRYSNKCRYDFIKCTNKPSLETVDMSLCELAEKKTHPDYRIC